MVKRKTQTKPNATEAAQPTNWTPLMVQREKAEIWFIKRFLSIVPVVKKDRRGNLKGKRFSRQEIAEFYNELARLIIARHIVKVSPYRSQIELIQRKLSLVLQKMGSHIEFGITPQVHTVLSRIVLLENVRPSVQLLKEYASLHGRPVRAVRDQIVKLRQEFITGVRNRSISKEDPFNSYIRTNIVPSLTYFLEGEGRRKKVFIAKNIALNGLEQA